jgi:hypothetical protein
MKNTELKNVKFRKGIILPKYRILIYRELLKELKIAKRDNEFCFMCVIIEHDILKGNRFFIHGCNSHLLFLPELAKQRPTDAKYAWYEDDDYDSRIKNVKDAIALWEKKFSK